MRSIRTLLLPFALLVVPITAQADDIDAIEKKVTEMWSKYNSASADMSIEMTTPMGPAKATGTMLFMRKEGKELSRTDMTMEMDMGGQKMTIPQTVINDGEWVYTISEMMGQKNGQKSKPKGMDGSMGGAEMFKRLRESHDLKVLPDETVDGESMYVIEAKPKEVNPMGPTMFKMYISKKSGFTSKFVGSDATGKETMSMMLSNIKINEKVDAAKFVPPTDVTFVQMGG